MSARAAARLRSLEFDRILRYTPGKMDWVANGLPVEGRHTDQPRAGDLVRHDIPTGRPHEPLRDIAARMKASRWDLCAVLDDEHVLLGLIDAGALRREGSLTFEQVMQSGPTTIRPHLTLDELGARLKKRDHVLVTTSDGAFLGLLLRSDIERKMIEREHSMKDAR